MQPAFLHCVWATYCLLFRQHWGARREAGTARVPPGAAVFLLPLACLTKGGIPADADVIAAAKDVNHRVCFMTDISVAWRGGAGRA